MEGRSYSTVDDPFAWVHIADKVKNINVEVFNLMLWVNETRHLSQHGSCKYKCGSNESVFNSK